MAKIDKEKASAAPTSVRVTPVCDYLWEEIAKGKGLSKSKVLEIIIRDRAKQEGIEIPSELPKNS